MAYRTACDCLGLDLIMATYSSFSMSSSARLTSPIVTFVPSFSAISADLERSSTAFRASPWLLEKLGGDLFQNTFLNHLLIEGFPDP